MLSESSSLLSDFGPVFISLLSACCESDLKAKNVITVVTYFFFFFF